MKKNIVWGLVYLIAAFGLVSCGGSSANSPGASTSSMAITAFSFSNPPATGVVNESTKTISITVPYGTNVTGLVATFTTTGASVKVGGVAQVSGTTANDFTSPVVYTVTAADHSTTQYTVTVTVALSSSKTLASFSILGIPGAINESSKTVALSVPYGTNVTGLVATFTTTGASVKVDGVVQVSETTANDFTNPVVYIVTATDGSTTQYTVTVTVAAQPPMLKQNWVPATLLENVATEDVKESEVAIDDTGNAFVVWCQNGNTWAARYSSSEAKWGPAQVIVPDHRTGSFTFSSDPHVVADRSGNVMVVWVDPGTNPWKIWGMWYNHDSGTWESSVLIETNAASGASKNPRVVVDPSGNFTTLWVQEDRTVWPFRNHIWASRYSAASNSWGIPRQIDTAVSSQYAGGYLQAAIDDSGNIMAIWNELDGAANNAWAARYSAKDGLWEEPVLLKTNTMSGAYDLQIAMDGSGNAVAVWVEDDSNTGVVYSHRYVWMNRYVAATGQWGRSIMIPVVSQEDMFNPQVVLDGKGNATIVGATGGLGRYRLWAMRYSFINDTMSVPAYLSQDDGIISKLAADRAGNELCVYMVADGHSTLQALPFNAGTAAWQTAKQVSSGGWSGGYVKLAANRKGNAITAWAQSDGLTYHLWASVLK